MACHQDNAKPLSEPMLTYCQFDLKEHISMKFYLKFKYFHSGKCVWKCRLRNGGHFVQGEINNMILTALCTVLMMNLDQSKLRIPIGRPSNIQSSNIQWLFHDLETDLNFNYFSVAGFIIWAFFKTCLTVMLRLLCNHLVRAVGMPYTSTLKYSRPNVI